MNEDTNINMELDPRLKQMLNAYGVTPKRNPESARRTREKFMVEIKSIFDGRPSAPVAGWFGFSEIAPNLRRFILYTLTTVSVVALFLFGGVGITAYAASSSLPGDTLYPLKITSEKVQANLVSAPDDQARLYLDFAGRRVSETQSLIGEGRYKDIVQAASEFENDIQKTLNAAENFSHTNPAQAITLNTEIDTSLRGYTAILMQLMALTPGDIQPVIQHAINTSQLAVSDDDDDDDDGADDDNSDSMPTSTVTPVITTTPTPAVIATTTPGFPPGGSVNDNDDGNDDDGNDDDDDNDDDDNDDDNDDDDDGDDD